MASRILIILTSNAQMGTGGKPTGLWAEELAVPCYELADIGAQITLASPAGGAIPFDPGSLSEGATHLAVVRMQADSALQAALAHTTPVAELNGGACDPGFFPGGHGTMWDLPDDPGVARAVESGLAAQRFVVSFCHGGAGLVGARRPDGQSVVAGLRVDNFTDAEERAVGLQDTAPFLLDPRLRAPRLAPVVHAARQHRHHGARGRQQSHPGAPH